jgi:hypothetical protein
MEENHLTEDFSGLESLGNSQIVENIGTFLSLEDLGLKPGDGDEDYIPLDNVNLTTDPTEPVEPVKPEGTTTTTTEVVTQPTVTEDVTGLEGLNALDEGVTTDGDDIIPTSGETNYKSILQDLISEGILPEIGSFETPDGDVPFEEMEIDKESLLFLIRKHQEDLKEEMKSSSIDVNGVSEFTKKLINIEKHGGNVQQALETYQQVKHPIETINLNDPTGQKAMCYLRFKAQGIEDGMAKDLINAYELKGILEEKALESKEQLDVAFNQSIIEQEELAIKQEQDFKAALKTYRGTLDSVLKDQQVSDTHRRKLLDIATKQTPQGDFELDVYIENFRKNPIDAVDLLMFVTNKQEFIKKKADELIKEERKNTLRKVALIPKGRTTNLTVPEQSTTKNDPYLLDLSKL